MMTSRVVNTCVDNLKFHGPLLAAYDHQVFKLHQGWVDGFNVSLEARNYAAT